MAQLFFVDFFHLPTEIYDEPKKLTYGHQENKNRRKHYAPAWISVEMVGFEPMT